MRVLVCWLGYADLHAAEGKPEAGLGPIGQAARERAFDEIVVLSDHDEAPTERYERWLQAQTEARVQTRIERLSSPTHFGDIYRAVCRTLEDLTSRHGENVRFTFHLSPGTPAMAAVWILVAKTRFPAELIESSPTKGVATVSVPFAISAEFIPVPPRVPDRMLEVFCESLPPEAPEFADIVHQSPAMRRVVAKARRVAPRSVPVLIEGESGTGKELLARAIHKASARRDKPFVTVNCGAIPSDLVESELFGYEKGAFTGAHSRRIGYFEAAHQGTLFLDEIGELPPTAQVKILRALQEKRITRVGSTREIPIDIRVIAATNRHLLQEVTAGRFRADLFYRLAVAILKLPPLRDREGDLSLLIDHLLAQVNEESRHESGHVQKKFSPGAKNLLLRHSWPGNVRELLNTIRRAVIWSSGSVIDADEVRDALLPSAPLGSDGVLDRPLSGGFRLQDVLAEVTRHYLSRALTETAGNKTRAAKLLGFNNYQTLSNWMKRYGLEE